MKLLQHLLEMAKKRNKKKKKPNIEVEKQRNFVAKHAQNKSGAGAHQDKQGKREKSHGKHW